jgi:hypothetical protein
MFAGHPHMKKILLFLTGSILFLEFVVTLGCANIVPPSGGPRDSISPVLVEVNPGDSTRNFSANRIVFTFDEYVDVQNAQSQLLVSPAMNVNPDITFRLNTVTVRLRDTLDPNTTYNIQFGDAIRDYTEGNPIRNFVYTFSTGPYIDSLELRGNVVLAETGKIDTTLIVMLHTNPADSAVVRERPRYVAKLDGRGQFVFRNLPARTFYLYALKDEGGTRRYFNDRQLFAFAPDPVVMQGEMEPVTLYAYAVKPAQATGTSGSIGLNPGGRRPGSGPTQETRLRFTTNLNENLQDLLSPLEIRFETELRDFDSTQLKLYTDSVFNPAPASKVLDTLRKKIIVSTNWKENTAYHLVMERDFAVDSMGKRLLKSDTLSFTTRKRADYGSLKLKFRDLDMNRKPVLQLVINNTIYKSIPLPGPEYSAAMMPPGDYEMRILYDENGNGIWDPGIFFGQRKQPEIVKPVERKITVKANWQNDFEIQL